MTNRNYTKNGYCHRWGQEFNARRVAGLTPEERERIRNGDQIYLSGCPKYKGETDRLIVEIGGRFYTRSITN